MKIIYAISRVLHGWRCDWRMGQMAAEFNLRRRQIERGIDETTRTFKSQIRAVKKLQRDAELGLEGQPWATAFFAAELRSRMDDLRVPPKYDRHDDGEPEHDVE